MSFHKLSTGGKKLLDELVEANSPASFLSSKLKEAEESEKKRLKIALKELRDSDYVKVQYSGNIPYYVAITDSGMMYDELLEEYEAEKAREDKNIAANYSIQIGNGNVIKGTTIANSINKNTCTQVKKEKKTFTERHPILAWIWKNILKVKVLLGGDVSNGEE